MNPKKNFRLIASQIRSLHFSPKLKRLTGMWLIAITCLFWQAGTRAQAFQQPTNNTPGAAPGTGAQTPPNPYSISPSRLEVGKEYEVLVQKSDCQNEDLSKGMKITAPQGSGVVVLAKLPAGPCMLAAKLSVVSDASVGKSILWIKDGANVPVNSVEIEKIPIAAGPIPPGLDPQVDIMWGVMDKKIVRDNFGHDLANDFYGIQLVIGNNSGYDLQIAGVGFQLPNKNIKNTIPSNSYRATRGVLEREQEFGRRSIILNSIQATGGLLTGFLPFWRAGFHPNAAANAARWSSIVGGPLTTGFGLILPDTTVKQIVRLDDQMLRDGLIVKNNSQIRSLIFVPKQLLNLSKTSGANDPDNLRKGDPSIKDWSIDPQYVNQKLNNLVLVGQTINYVNRVQVVARSEGGGVTPPPTITGVSGQLLQGEKRQLVFTGVNLKDAVIAFPEGIDIVPNSVKIDENGNSLRADIIVAETVIPDDYSLVISTPAGSSAKTINVEAQTPAVTDFNYTKPKAGQASDATVVVTLKGTYLRTVKEVRFVPGPQEEANTLSIKPPDSQSNGDLKFTVTVKKMAKAGKYKLDVCNHKCDGRGKSASVEFEVIQ